MAAAEGLVQGPASIGAGLLVVMVTWSICSPCISLRRVRRRSKDDWVPLCRASRLVLSSRHFCRGRGVRREGSQTSTVQASWGDQPSGLSPKSPPLPLQRPERNQAADLTKTRQQPKMELNSSQRHQSLFSDLGLDTRAGAGVLSLTVGRHLTDHICFSCWKRLRASFGEAVAAAENLEFAARFLLFLLPAVFVSFSRLYMYYGNTVKH